MLRSFSLNLVAGLSCIGQGCFLIYVYPGVCWCWIYIYIYTNIHSFALEFNVFTWFRLLGSVQVLVDLWHAEPCLSEMMIQSKHHALGIQYVYFQLSSIIDSENL